MDKKDKIILQQLDVIRSMTENSMKRMNSDFWGTPFENVTGSAPKSPAPTGSSSNGGSAPAPEKKAPLTATAKPGDEKPAEEELPPPEKIEDLLAELDSYIGLGVVKEEVHNLINMVQVYKLRQQHDLPTTDMSLHMVFTGNPGTGKTMMARMMARIYRSLGILSKGQLVEVDRSGLVAGYVGQTALKTQKVIEKAMGGVLFIDEAYALYRGGEDSFGLEAIDTLVKGIEDHRDDLVVILAGYTKEMQLFLSANSGLASRFPNQSEFPDYTGAELYKILCSIAKGKGYTLDDACKLPLVTYFDRKQVEDAATNGNGRMARNTLEKAILNQSKRLVADPDASLELLLPGDFELE